MQPSILSDLIGIISCKTIDGSQYISKELTLQCYT